MPPDTEPPDLRLDECNHVEKETSPSQLAMLAWGLF